MAAGGGTDDADAGGVASVAFGEDAEQAERAGGVVEHRRVAIAVGAEPVFEDVGGDPVSGKEFGVAGALMFGEAAVAAAGENED